MNDEDDPVLREIDVFMSKGVDGRLCLLQMPLRTRQAAPGSGATPQPAPAGARLKRAHRVLEVNYPLNTAGENYDKDADAHVTTDQQVYVGKATPAMTHYAVGAMRDGALHLTPLDDLIQLRPSLAHVKDAPSDELEEDAMDAEDEGGAKGAVRTSSADSAAAMAASDEKAAAAAAALQEVQYRKKESEKALAQHRRSFAFHRQQLESEPWIELEVVEETSDAAVEEFEKLYFRAGAGAPDAGDTKQSLKEEREAPGNYLDSLNYTGAPETSGRPSLQIDVEVKRLCAQAKHAVGTGRVEAPAGELSTRALRSLPAQAQVLSVLRAAAIVTFGDMVHLCGNATSGEYVLQQLQRFAVLLRGRWVVKTALTADGADPKRAACRELALWALSQRGFVFKNALMEATGLDWKATKSVLEPFARRERGETHYVLRLSEDVNFVAENPQVVQDQAAAWAMRRDDVELSPMINVLEAVEQEDRSLDVPLA